MAHPSWTPDIAHVLRNIREFAPSNEAWKDRFGMNQTWHWFKHCFAALADIQNVLTDDQYLKLAQEFRECRGQTRPWHLRGLPAEW